MVIGGMALLAGYLWSMIRRIERPVSAELVAFRRREQMQRLKKFLTGERDNRVTVNKTKNPTPNSQSVCG
jgi:hypothetical protein